MYIIKIYELYIINCVAHLKIAINARIMTSVHRISNSRFIFAKKNSKKKEKKGKFIWKRRKKIDFTAFASWGQIVRHDKCTVFSLWRIHKSSKIDILTIYEYVYLHAAVWIELNLDRFGSPSEWYWLMRCGVLPAAGRRNGLNWTQLGQSECGAVGLGGVMIKWNRQIIEK